MSDLGCICILVRQENNRLREAIREAVRGHDVVISNGGTGWSRHVEEPLWKLRALIRTDPPKETEG